MRPKCNRLGSLQNAVWMKPNTGSTPPQQGNGSSKDQTRSRDRFPKDQTRSRFTRNHIHKTRSTKDGSSKDPTRFSQTSADLEARSRDSSTKQGVASDLHIATKEMKIESKTELYN